jgi:hypothetical protein
VTRTDIITALIRRNGYRAYLEIGVATGANITGVVDLPGLHVVGVDPLPQSEYVTHPVDSDTFFRANREKFDLAFVDGLHLEEQVDRDILNALATINVGGMVVVHDCNPAIYEHATADWLRDEWNGTVWRSVTKLRCTNAQLTIRVVDEDYGCAIITRGRSELYTKASIDTCLDWAYFDANRREILNLISRSEFESIYL